VFTGIKYYKILKDYMQEKFKFDPIKAAELAKYLFIFSSPNSSIYKLYIY